MRSLQRAAEVDDPIDFIELVSALKRDCGLYVGITQLRDSHDHRYTSVFLHIIYHYKQ